MYIYIYIYLYTRPLPIRVKGDFGISTDCLQVRDQLCNPWFLLSPSCALQTSTQSQWRHLRFLWPG